jgi:hypothetical protein
MLIGHHRSLTSTPLQESDTSVNVEAQQFWNVMCAQHKTQVNDDNDNSMTLRMGHFSLRRCESSEPR